MTLTVKPAPRWNFCMAELPTSSELVLGFGQTTAELYNGVTAYSGLLNDFWSWNGTAFTNISTGISGNTLTAPLPRASASCAYDGYQIIMVGGAGPTKALTETWSYKTSGGWTQQAITDTITVNPPPLFNQPNKITGAAFCRMSSTETCLLFSGEVASNRNYTIDQWNWSGSATPGTWSYTTSATPTQSNTPSGRKYASMASNGTTAVLFGGKTLDGPQSSTWEYTALGGWTQTATSQTPGTSSPCARYGASFAYDANDSVFVLHGGIAMPGNFSKTAGYCIDSWTYSTSTHLWSQITGPQPPARAYASSSYLTATTTVYMFGGLNSLTSLNDLWSYTTAGGWTLVG